MQTRFHSNISSATLLQQKSIELQYLEKTPNLVFMRVLYPDRIVI